MEEEIQVWISAYEFTVKSVFAYLTRSRNPAVVVSHQIEPVHFQRVDGYLHLIAPFIRQLHLQTCLKTALANGLRSRNLTNVQVLCPQPCVHPDGSVLHNEIVELYVSIECSDERVYFRTYVHVVYGPVYAAVHHEPLSFRKLVKVNFFRSPCIHHPVNSSRSEHAARQLCVNGHFPHVGNVSEVSVHCSDETAVVKAYPHFPYVHIPDRTAYASRIYLRSQSGPFQHRSKEHKCLEIKETISENAVHLHFVDVVGECFHVVEAHHIQRNVQI